MWSAVGVCAGEEWEGRKERRDVQEEETAWSALIRPSIIGSGLQIFLQLINLL